ncbi:MAG: DNA-formamidopyrimidine glycosylase [Mycoplasma sp.]
MPELPEVETVVRYLNKVCLNREIESVNVRLIKLLKNIEPLDFQKKLKNKTITKVERRGKYLIFSLDNLSIIVSHLRMEGKFYFEDEELTVSKHDHIIFKFKDGSQLKYNDTRQFGTIHYYKNIDEANASKSLSKLGAEPFTSDMDINKLYPLFKKSNKPIKTFLLDQTKIAGIGNIYVNEILFQAGINPTATTSKLDKKTISKIIDITNEILADSIKHNGTTIHSFKFDKWSTGGYQEYLRVHQQKVCPKCNGEIKKIVVGQRGTYYCPKCQKKEK